MSLRQLQRRGATALSDGSLLKVLRSELTHELSSPPPTSLQVGSLVAGGFSLEWDDPRTQDVVLRRREEDEEVAVTAVLAPLRFKVGEPLPRNALMKVCVKNPGSEPVLRFDCLVFRREEEGEEEGVVDYRVRSACYYRSVDDHLGEFKYRGPAFSNLDLELQRAWNEYLRARGIGVELTSFLLEHLHKKEQGQYVSWLRTVEGVVTKNA